MKTTIPTVTGSSCLVPSGPTSLTPSGPGCLAPSGPRCHTFNRLEMIAKRQRSARWRQLLFIFFVALAAMSGATTIGAAVRGAAPVHIAQL